MSLSELSQDPFNPDEFIERLAWRSMKESGEHTGKDGLDKFEPMLLHGVFCKTIQQLRDAEKSLETKALVLESQCVEEEAKQRKKVKDLLRENQKAFENFQELDERINHVATKVVHLGDQLESVNVPRTRNFEALQMMRYLNMYFAEKDFVQDQMLEDPSRLAEAAELVQKLNVISLELPTNDPKFEKAKTRIDQSYRNIEDRLIKGFLDAYNYGKIEAMRNMCDLLRNFRRQYDIVDIFIKESQKYLNSKKDLIKEVEQLCLSTSDIVTQVFFSPENVMAKFLTSIYFGALRSYIDSTLQSKTGNEEEYLEHLSSLFANTTQLSNVLAEKLKFGTDPTFLMKMTKSNLFGTYLETYSEREFAYLRDKTSATLVKYYESRNHVKRQLQAGGFSDLRRDLQAMIHINIGPDIEGYTGEVFLSQEVAISILDDFKLAFARSKNLVSPKDLPKHAAQIYRILVQNLCSDFVDYAIELALYHCPLPDSKVTPNLHFFSAVSDTSAIIYLFEKQFADVLWPIVKRSPYQEECTNAKVLWIEKFESKLDLGLERTMMAICSYAKYLLTTEQKRTDFKPDKCDMNMMHSHACTLVVSYLSKTINVIKQHLDGQNLEKTLYEFGIRLHKVIFEHLSMFQYNSTGAMLAICDINEYRTCIKELNSEPIVELFDILHALCNLLVVQPDNLLQICSGEPLNQLEKSIVNSFIQLREDYKTKRLAGMLPK